MATKKSTGASTALESPSVPGSGRVAHQIIGEFLSQLEKQEGYAAVAERLRVAVLDNKPTEATVRAMLFGEEPL